MTTAKFPLAEISNALIFQTLKGYWVEISADYARMMFFQSKIKLYIFSGDYEVVIESESQLKKAIAENQIISIFLGNLEQSIADYQ